MPVLEIDTPHGPARAHVHARARAPLAALVLGHGAGGGVEAADLVRTREVALTRDVTVVLVEQPYRVAGRRSAAPAKQLDAAWIAVLARLKEDVLAGVPVLTGGRSSGARVACRTAAQTAAVAVLCLAFPLHPPRRSPDAPLKTRAPELDEVPVPVLVVQGRSDPFGMPVAAPGRDVVQVAGTHSLAKGLDAVGAAIGAWLDRLVPVA